VTTLPTPQPEETHVGPYRLLAPIGEGGMGVVHLAQGPDGRRVALKVLRPHVVGDVEARERLAREVSSLQRITSPRIAEILDADPHGPVPYVVTRYVPGLSLYHHVAEEGLVEGRDLLHFAGSLAEALLAVHSVGVLHRDVKPTNVLMEGRSPVLIDFGLARVAEDPRLTQTGWLLGTPGYLAPEILYGDDATVASDVHAWGATVVFAATGRPPYGTGPVMAIMDRVRRGEHDLSGVPAPLRDLVRAALSAEPLERPSVHELLDWVEDERRRSEPALAATTPAPSPTGPAPDLWTMPFAPRVPTEGPHARTTVLPPDMPVDAPSAPGTARPVREAAPQQTPPPVPARPEPRPVASRPPAPTHIVAPLQPHVQPGPAGFKPAGAVSGTQRILQLLGLGALTSATVAYAPYAGTAAVATLVLLLRTVSVTRQRHGRRRLIRGRPRWYDVPKTTLAMPIYLLLALFGAMVLVLGAALAGAAMFSAAYLFAQPVTTGMVMAGLGFTVALWWGPGSGRLREVTRGAVSRTAGTELGGWFVVAMCALATAVLMALLLDSGPNWAPALSAPWS
jgi:serine/threonine protein kinase